MFILALSTDDAILRQQWRVLPASTVVLFVICYLFGVLLSVCSIATMEHQMLRLTSLKFLVKPEFNCTLYVLLS
jgi:hypothetical protein